MPRSSCPPLSPPRFAPRTGRALAIALALALTAAWLTMAGPAGADPPAEALSERHQKLFDQADEIVAKVVTLRGLAQKRPIPRGVMQKHEIEQRLRERIDGEYSPEELAAEAMGLERLGLIPPGIDFKSLVVDLLTDQIAGFYDPIVGQLYIAGWQDEMLGAGGDAMLMAHELDHALQDQHFDLRAFLTPNRHNGDAGAARQALVEGDGTALMLEYQMSLLGLPPPWQRGSGILDAMGPQMAAAMATGKIAQAPLVLRESLVFPYLDGLRFVAYFRKTHDWDRIDAIFRKPPLSTEHILHPERYLRYERPDVVRAVPLPALAGHERVYHNVSGELGLAVLLRQHLLEPRTGGSRPDPAAVKALRAKIDLAAAGWGGDRLVVYAPKAGGDGGVVAISYSVWDHPADAMEFFDALTDAMPSLARGPAVAVADTRLHYRDPTGAHVVAERHGDAVVLVVGADEAQVTPLMAQIWRRWRVQRR
ncbi:hypothetical protein [Haliangium sp.]|uniref:hypothetical protein n=1 Tax=Haliangium sp. TaxID=2663208 RepID=UPI003D0D1416